MTNWSQILQLDEPVVGDVEDYEFAHEQVGALGATAETVRDQFKTLQTTELDELQGRAALRLRELVGTVDDCLTDLPVVLHDVEEIFKKHAQELKLLRTKAGMDRDGNRLRQLTTEHHDDEPTWSPDGVWMAFARGNEGSRSIYVVSSTGGDEPIQLLALPGFDYWAPSWSPSADVIVDPTFDCRS